MKTAITHGIAYMAGVVTAIGALAYLAFMSPSAPGAMHETPAVVRGSVGVTT